ncbi:MAG TPA: hypothetical protein VF681_15690 [Abditibacteriaceae bacterium]|jgi:hypothetical protein
MKPSPLFLPGWLEFNRHKFGFQPLHVHFPRDSDKAPSVETVLYLNKKGKIQHPPLNPCLPIHFQSTPTERPSRLGRQWLEVAGLLARDMAERGQIGSCILSADATDVRPWQWVGYRAQARYTYYLDFPFSQERVDRSNGTSVRKAIKQGYRCERVSDLQAVLQCVDGSELRKQFSYHLTLNDLQTAQEILGYEDSRTYVCYAPNGEPAAALMVLHQPGARAVPWVAGNAREHLDADAPPLVWKTALDDLSDAGAAGIDFAGANIRGVASAKANWGGELVETHALELPSPRSIALYLREYALFMRRKRVASSG